MKENIITADVLANRTNKERVQDNFYVSFLGFNENTGNFLGYQVKSVTRPSIEIDEIPHSHRNASYADPGRIRFSPITITFREDEDGFTSMLLYAQLMRQKKSYSGQYDHIFGKISSAYGRFGMKVSLYSSKNVETESFILHDCFIRSINHGDNITNGDRENEIQVTVSYDNIEIKIFDRFVSLKG